MTSWVSLPDSRISRTHLFTNHRHASLPLPPASSLSFSSLASHSTRSAGPKREAMSAYRARKFENIAAMLTEGVKMRYQRLASLAAYAEYMGDTARAGRVQKVMYLNGVNQVSRSDVMADEWEDRDREALAVEQTLGGAVESQLSYIRDQSLAVAREALDAEKRTELDAIYTHLTYSLSEYIHSTKPAPYTHATRVIIKNIAWVRRRARDYN